MYVRKLASAESSTDTKEAPAISKQNKDLKVLQCNALLLSILFLPLTICAKFQVGFEIQNKT